jgi:hypothetical protein
MRRRTNTLDAEYQRRGLIRPTQAAKLGLTFETASEGEGVQIFNWRGTDVWGVIA